MITIANDWEYRDVDYSPETPRERKLSRLRDHLINRWEFTDNPWEYITIHYHWNAELWIQWKSLEQLWLFLKDKWIDYADSEWLRQLMLSLKIEMKERQEKTKLWRKKAAQNSHNWWIAQVNAQKFREWLMVVLKAQNSQQRDFDIQYFESLRFSIDRALYLLWITKVELSQIAKQNNLWKKAITKAMNEKLWEIIEWLRWNWYNIDDIVLQDGSVWNILKNF